jgi:hypothetical protein
MLGTNEYYRSQEGLSPIGDRTEGRGSFHQTQDIGGNRQMRNNLFINNTMPNGLIFCTSMEEVSLDRFGKRDKYYINEIGKFYFLIYRLICSQFNSNHIRTNAAPITYDKDGVFTTGFNQFNITNVLYKIFFHKPSRFVDDKEFRFAFIKIIKRNRMSGIVPFRSNLELDISPLHSEFMKIVSLT